MSIKAYHAKTIPWDKLPEFEEAVVGPMRDGVAKMCAPLIEGLDGDVLAEWIDKEGWPMDESWSPVMIGHKAALMLNEKAKEWQNSPDGFHPFDPHCGWRMFTDGERLALLPWGNPQFREEIEFPDFVESFEYQNQVYPRNNDASDEEWEKRAEFWRNAAEMDACITAFRLGINADSFGWLFYRRRLKEKIDDEHLERLHKAVESYQNKS